jgi:predicted nuclease of restriction endonuclease-like (RecB) superfamily
MRNWVIGKIITEKQEKHAWGSNFLDLLAKDLQKMFPGNQGFSATNIYRMAAFYRYYRNITTAVVNLEKLPIFTIPWGHNALIFIKIKNQDEALWYAEKSIAEGWSRSTLEIQIKKDLYARQGKAISNFKETLEHSHAAITQQSFQDPYIFDFLTLDDNHIEQDLELGLMSNVQKLLLEMGKGFALYGRQYHVEVGGQDFYIDLLFYHTKLKCYVVVELKARAFEPKDAGQLNFYISAVDDLVRDQNDNPTIGLLLCKSKNNLTVEYTLRGINRPIGVSQYTDEIMKKLEKDFENNLPTIAELEAEFAKIEARNEISISKTIAKKK